MKLGTLCYIEKDGKTLMLHRNKKENDIHEGKWIGLGGKLEAGESPEECVLREVEEESGLILKDPTLRGVLTFPNFKGHDWYVFLYTATEFEGNLIESPEGDLHWIATKSLLDLHISEGDRLFLSWLREKKMFSAKFIYDGDDLVDYSMTEEHL